MNWLEKLKLRGARDPWININVGGPFKLISKKEIVGARVPWINIIVNYCCAACACAVVCEDAKKTETKETIVFFVTFLSLVVFQLGGPGPLGPPLATSMIRGLVK